MTRIFLFSFFLSCVLLISGQNHQDTPLRVEMPAKSDDESHRIIPCGTTGALMYFKSVEKENDSLVKWYFSFYDSNLKRLWIKSVGISEILNSYNFEVNEKDLSILFAKGVKEKSDFSTYFILKLNLLTAEFTGIKGILPGKSEPSSFSVNENVAVIGYNINNESAGLIIRNIVTGSIFEKKWSDGVKSHLTGVSIDTTTSKIYGFLKKSYVKNKYEYFIVEMDFSGNIKREILINEESNGDFVEKYILDLNAYPSGDKDMIAYGTYRSGAAKRLNDKSLSASPATGVYFMTFTDGKLIKSRFTNFLTLDNLISRSNYSGLMKKAEKKKRDIADYSLDYPALVHPLKIIDSTFLFTTELFSPQFHTENYTDFDFYGRPYTNSYRVFDGYKFNNCILINYDIDGNILWDNNMEIINLVSYDLIPKVNVTVSPDSAMVLSYLSQGKIGYIVIKEDKVIEKLDFSPLEMMIPEDKLISESKSRMVLWYGNYYLCFGYQDIKNINSSENRNRKVFYFTKVKFE